MKTGGAQGYSHVKGVAVEETQDEVVIPPTSIETVEPVEITSGGAAIFKGVMQPLGEYRDWQFAAAFIIHLVIVVILSFTFKFADTDDGSSTSSSSSSSSSTSASDDAFVNAVEDAADSDAAKFISGFFVFFGIAVCSALAATAAGLYVMAKYPRESVQFSFFFTPAILFVLAFVLLILGDQDGAQYMATVGIVKVAIMAFLYNFYKRFFAFAAANLQTAMKALHNHQGLFGLGLGFSFLANVWYIVWFAAIGSVFYRAGQTKVPCYESSDSSASFSSGGTNEDDQAMCDEVPNMFVIFLLVVSLYWTIYVILNTVHTTTAGTVGSFLYSPLDQHRSPQNCCSCCCNPTISDAWYRASTYSFGSICFGSLLVAIIQAMRDFAESGRRRRGSAALLACICQCILTCLAAYLEYFNSWAFVFVGLYGYKFMDAGKNVITMFQQRGWSVFVSDRLTFRVLLFAQIAIAALGGLVSMILEWMFLGRSALFSGDQGAGFLVSFLVSLVLAFVISGNALFVVNSAVRTTIVCFAEDPTAIQQHHPNIFETLRSGYGEAYPGRLDGAGLVHNPDGTVA